jgi:hypothetical protein
MTMLAKQPLVALVTVIAWLWLAFSAFRWCAHFFAIAQAALTQFLG